MRMSEICFIFVIKKNVMRILVLCLLALAVFHTSAKSQNLNITHRSTVTFNNQNLANIWGYAANGYEYALVGGKDGLIIVNVTNPDAPVALKQIPGPSSPWREIRTYQHYAYVVTEGGAVGVQIVNLSNLPDTNLVWKNVSIGGLTRAHALDVDEARGFLYLYGSNVNGGRAIVWNLSNPYNPTYAGTYTPIGYVHDGYTNNDTMYSAHIYQAQSPSCIWATKAARSPWVPSTRLTTSPTTPGAAAMCCSPPTRSPTPSSPLTTSATRPTPCS